MRPSLLGLALALSGCALEPIDLSNRRCPCIAGWVCDEARDRCVEESEAGLSDARPPDAARPRDAGRDARGALDAGPPDATVAVDSAIGDASLDDASLEDATVEDATVEDDAIAEDAAGDAG